jgi:hypothetical protein
VIRFLSLSEVLLIYEDQVRRYGGIYGVRDIHLLSSAVYVPQAMYEEEYLHKTVPPMAYRLLRTQFPLYFHAVSLSFPFTYLCNIIDTNV